MTFINILQILVEVVAQQLRSDDIWARCAYLYSTVQKKRQFKVLYRHIEMNLKNGHLENVHIAL